MDAVILEETQAGITIVNGKPYMLDAKGNLVPVESVKPAHKLEDETVRKIMTHARNLSAQIGRFKQHTFDDLGSFEAILSQEYGVSKGGAKGNKTFMTIDGLMKVQVAVSDYLDFGPEIQQAKALIDECLIDWSTDSRAEMRALVTQIFNTEKAGKIDRAGIFLLLRHHSDDPRWKRAMEAIREAMRPVGSKTYVRCYERASHDAEWRAVTIDLAKA